jgi:hypothetical protein
MAPEVIPDWAAIASAFWLEHGVSLATQQALFLIALVLTIYWALTPRERDGA